MINLSCNARKDLVSIKVALKHKKLQVLIKNKQVKQQFISTGLGDLDSSSKFLKLRPGLAQNKSLFKHTIKNK